VLGGGKHDLTVTAAATSDYNEATQTVSIDVNKADQTITWVNPAAIPYRHALGSAQLNATVSVPGPAAHGALTFTRRTPGDPQRRRYCSGAEDRRSWTDNYNPASKTVSITVTKADQTITLSAPHRGRLPHALCDECHLDLRLPWTSPSPATAPSRAPRQRTPTASRWQRNSAPPAT